MNNGEKPETKPVFMEVDPELWTQAKVQAVKDGIPLKEWVSQAIREKLAHPVPLR